MNEAEKKAEWSAGQAGTLHGLEDEETGSIFAPAPKCCTNGEGSYFAPKITKGGFDMSGSNSAERKRHEPLVLVETADLFRRRLAGLPAPWNRRQRDVSAIFGTSPFRTARDLYYDKLNIASVEDDEGNWGCRWKWGIC